MNLQKEEFTILIYYIFLQKDRRFQGIIRALRNKCLLLNPRFQIGIGSLIVIALIPQCFGQHVAAGCTALPVSQYKGVNFIDKRLVAVEDTTNPNYLNFRTPSMYDRLNEIKSIGLNTIRVPYYWEAYNANAASFVKGLQEISTTADQLNLCVVYDFQQYITSSHFDHSRPGGGFPSFLTGSYSANSDGESAFWTDYYNNNISYNGTKIWDLQFNFIRNVIIKNVDSHPSTAGYEILNEPPVYDCNQYVKVGNVNTYIGNKIRSVVLKPIYFDRAENLGRGCRGFYNYEPYDILALPRGVSNIVFAPHIYVTGWPTFLTYLISLSQKWQPGMPVFIGEWGPTLQNGIVTQVSVVSQDMVNNYLQAFKSNNVGWAYYSWDPVIDFAVKDQLYRDTVYKEYLQNGINSIDGEKEITYDPGFICGNNYWGIKNSQNSNDSSYKFGKDENCNNILFLIPYGGVRNYVEVTAHKNADRQYGAWQAAIQGTDPWKFDSKNNGAAIHANDRFPLPSHLNYGLDVQYLWFSDNVSKPGNSNNNSSAQAKLLIGLWFVDTVSPKTIDGQYKNILVIEASLANLENADGKWKQSSYTWNGELYNKPFIEKSKSNQTVYHYPLVLDNRAINPM